MKSHNVVGKIGDASVN